MDNTANNVGKGQLKGRSFENLSLKSKITMVLVNSSISSLVLTFIAIVVFQYTKETNYAGKEMKVLADSKKEEVNRYFQSLQGHARVLARDENVKNAMVEFTRAFQSIQDEMASFSGFRNEEDQQRLEKYYLNNHLDHLTGQDAVEYSLDNVMPRSPAGRFLQTEYTAKNPNPAHSKHIYIKPTNEKQYDVVHSKYQQYFMDKLEYFGFEDILFIDQDSGKVVYSVSKNVDFGTSLINGPYKRSNLARLFGILARANVNSFVSISKFETYFPARFQPSAFIGIPVFDGLEKIGVLVIRVSNEQINNIMLGQVLYSGVDVNKTREMLLVSSDAMIVNDSRFWIEDQKQFVETITGGNDISPGDLERSALNVSIPGFSFENSMQGNSGVLVEKDYRGKKVVSAFTSVFIGKHPHAIIVKQDRKEILSSTRVLVLIAIISLLVSVSIVYMLGNHFARSISSRIGRLRKSIQTLSRGNLLQKLDYQHSDEIGETIMKLNDLSGRMSEASEFALKIGQGDFSIDITPFSDEDMLGVSLAQMKRSLQSAQEEQKKRDEEDKKRNWATSGIAKFSEILREENEDLEQLSYRVISNLVEYMEINQGGFYTVDEDEEGERKILLKSAYAFNKQKFLKKTVDFGEGLIGTCAIEQKRIKVKSIPDDYLYIDSGLGEALPRHLLLMPFIYEDEVFGLCELASFQEIEDYKIEFLEDLCEIIATTLRTLKMNQQTARLLEESNNKASELSSQEEELRQNLEEMQATQEELERIKNEQDAKQEEMQSMVQKNLAMLSEILNNVSEKVYLKDGEGKFLVINDAMALEYGREPDQILGNTIDAILDDKEAFLVSQEEKEVLDKGKKEVEEEFGTGDEKERYKITMMPFYIEFLGQTGILYLKNKIIQ